MVKNKRALSAKKKISWAKLTNIYRFIINNKEVRTGW